MKTYILKTPTTEVIDYSNIEVEVSEDTIIPEKTETKTELYTPARVQSELDSINEQITTLTASKAVLVDMQTKIKTEANKVKK